MSFGLDAWQKTWKWIDKKTIGRFSLLLNVYFGHTLVTRKSLSSTRFHWTLKVCQKRFTSLVWKFVMPKVTFWSYQRPSVTWLILPVVICLSQRLSHACLYKHLYCELIIKVDWGADSDSDLIWTTVSLSPMAATHQPSELSNPQKNTGGKCYFHWLPLPLLQLQPYWSFKQTDFVIGTALDDFQNTWTSHLIKIPIEFRLNFQLLHWVPILSSQDNLNVLVSSWVIPTLYIVESG